MPKEEIEFVEECLNQDDRGAFLINKMKTDFQEASPEDLDKDLEKESFIGIITQSGRKLKFDRIVFSWRINLLNLFENSSFRTVYSLSTLNFMTSFRMLLMLSLLSWLSELMSCSASLICCAPTDISPMLSERTWVRLSRRFISFAISWLP